jgi:hypothetical protein
MKSILICPDERRSVGVFSETAPLANVPILGESLLEYWLAHQAVLGAREVLVLAVDRPEQIGAAIGDGARWGLQVTVIPENRELTIAEARARYQLPPGAPKQCESSGSPDSCSGWLPFPNDIIVMDRVPGLPEVTPLASYAHWFAAARALMPRALTPDRVGIHEVQPGVWVGLHTHVAQGAKLIGPCWIDDHAWIEAETVIGPHAILERETCISHGAQISNSLIGPRTFVGKFTEVSHSIAWGPMLINWERDSCVKVTDEFLLSSLQPHHAQPQQAAKQSVGLRLRDYATQIWTRVFAESGPPH